MGLLRNNIEMLTHTVDMLLGKQKEERTAAGAGRTLVQLQEHLVQSDSRDQEEGKGKI